VTDAGSVDLAKAAVAGAVDGARDELVELSHRIHGTPEIAFEEERASTWVADALAKAGFDVEHGVCDLPTAFTATAGSGTLTIGICAEYDALPGLGHACGHNVIAAAAVGAARALAPLADDLDITVRVLGTPAEERGGGKILMLERGAFDGVHASMMVHPTPYESVEMPCLAVGQLRPRFHGRSAPATFPQDGINAADALTIAQVALGLLRQHIRLDERIHGIVTGAGDVPNVIPHEATGWWSARAATTEALEPLTDRVRACFEAGAVATGATLSWDEVPPVYSHMEADVELGELYRRNAVTAGRTFDDDLDPNVAGSTDMANVSLAMPAIHPLLSLDCLPAVNHQPGFAAAAVSDRADGAVRDGAVLMAWTAIDAATAPPVRQRLLGNPATYATRSGGSP